MYPWAGFGGGFEDEALAVTGGCDSGLGVCTGVPNFLELVGIGMGFAPLFKLDEPGFVVDGVAGPEATPGLGVPAFEVPDFEACGVGVPDFETGFAGVSFASGPLDASFPLDKSLLELGGVPGLEALAASFLDASLFFEPSPALALAGAGLPAASGFELLIWGLVRCLAESQQSDPSKDPERGSTVRC